MRIPLALGALLCAMLVAVPAAEAAPTPRSIAYTQWDGAAEWRTGTFAGTKVADSRLVLVAPTALRPLRRPHLRPGLVGLARGSRRASRSPS